MGSLTSNRPEDDSINDTTDDSDILMKLPTEIIECIFDYVPLIDGLIACHVSSVWNQRLSSLQYYWKKRAEPYIDERSFEADTNWKSLCELVVGSLSKFPTACGMIDTKRFTLPLRMVLVAAYHSDYLLVGDRTERLLIPHAIIYKLEKDWTLVCSFDMSPVVKRVEGCVMTQSKIVCTAVDRSVAFWSFDRSSNKVSKICARDYKCEGPVKVLVASDELDIVVLLGKEYLNLWDLKTGRFLRSFPAVRSGNIQKFEESSFLNGWSEYTSNQGDYDDDPSSPKSFKLIQSSLSQKDFVITKYSAGISEETIAKLRQSMRTCRKESAATLRTLANNIFPTGRLFSLFQDRNGDTYLLLNATRDSVNIGCRVGGLLASLGRLRK